MILNLLHVQCDEKYIKLNIVAEIHKIRQQQIIKYP